jgi:hypothetical protein
LKFRQKIIEINICTDHFVLVFYSFSTPGSLSLYAVSILGGDDSKNPATSRVAKHRVRHDEARNGQMRQERADATRGSEHEWVVAVAHDTMHIEEAGTNS